MVPDLVMGHFSGPGDGHWPREFWWACQIGLEIRAATCGPMSVAVKRGFS